MKFLTPFPKYHLPAALPLAFFATWFGMSAMNSAFAKSPPMIEPPLEIAAMSEENYRHSEGSMIVLPDGTLLLAWSRFYVEEGKPKDDNGPANIVLSRSQDGGRTWSEPEALDLPRGRINNMQASLLQLGDKTLLVYSKRNATAGKDAADRWIIESTDLGKTWSEPRRITPGDGRYTGPNDRLLRLRSGRLLLPSHVPLSGNDHGELAPLMVWSDDEGANWKTGQPILPLPEFHQLKKPLKLHEPSVVELSNGDLLMLARTTNGRFFRSISRDGGETWTTAEPTEIESLTAPPQLKKLSDGRLLLVWNPLNNEAHEFLNKGSGRHLGGEGEVPGYIRRTVLAAATSSDDGKTWSEPLVLIDGGEEFGYCYPAAVEVGGEILIAASKTPDIIYPASLVLFRVPVASLP